MFMEDALDIVYSYVATICNENELSLVSEELLAIVGKTKYAFCKKKDVAISYIKAQNMLSKLNEKESIRKSKGVYYTPYDVVRFIVTNTIKAAYGKLRSQNIGQEELTCIPYRSFAIKKTVYDPTCGAGEYLLVALEKKLDLLNHHYKKVSGKMVRETVATIFGNDINKESIVITKLRLFICVLKKTGISSIRGLASAMKANFYTYDYIQTAPKKRCYDIIVGNPPYVEDSDSGLELDKRYGNIYANVLINAADQLSSCGSLGFIVPLSYISTPRMSDLRDELFNIVTEQYILSYADRPDCLFDSVHQKLCILIGKKKKCRKTVYTGNYQYWYKEERENLFRKTQVVRNTFYSKNGIPKLGMDIDVAIFKKITDLRKFDSVYDKSRHGNESVYLNRRETFWMKAYRERVDDPEYKIFSFNSAEAADYCYCLINSSLFWWYWVSTSDCWHVSRELNGFMAPFNGDYRSASKLAYDLRDRLEKTKVYVGTKQTEYEYKHRECIKEIHAIDTYINALFGLTEEESEYIKGFAFRYRTSGGAE
ncbi:MAG: SAM-dependent methyltransferase [Ruminococcus sp.]|nr:SAM-dependent methyltransferase [Ruminococcus sp.]